MKIQLPRLSGYDNFPDYPAMTTSPTIPAMTTSPTIRLRQTSWTIRLRQTSRTIAHSEDCARPFYEGEYVYN